MLSGFAEAAPQQAATAQVSAQLVASVDAVHPGDKIQVGVEQKIIPHWHTYWINPGDSGLATRISWNLPPGASAGEIQWPIPARYVLGPITNYGYADQVTLLSEIVVPSDIAVGSRFPIEATVDWLVCADICIPQQVKLGIELPVLAPGAAAGAGSPLIEQALARLPVASPWPVRAEAASDGLLLHLQQWKLQAARVSDVWFYAERWGSVVHGAEQPYRQVGDALVLKLQPGDAPAQPGENLSGVLVVTEKTADGLVSRGYRIDAAVSVAAGAAASAAFAENEAPALGFSSALLLALLGGLILNLMPCVFPVLSFKALSLLQHAEQAPVQVRLHGWVYTAGILFSFALLGGLLIALKAAGTEVGWGFQFQSPVFVVAVAYLMFAVGLSLSGVFDVGASIVGAGSSLADRPGYLGSFFTGVLATIVATPCTAPFMGAALGYALTQPPAVLLAVFLSLGLGLALPYLLLSHWPALTRHLPRPGVWMSRVKQVLAFPMYAAAVWLVWVLAQQAGANAVAIALGGMLIFALAAWIYDSTRAGGPRQRLLGIVAAALLCTLTAAATYSGIKLSAVQSQQLAASGQGWEPYTAERLQGLRAKGEPVFLNFTAAWCITCLVNERVALSEASVTTAFSKAGITYLKGDWTNQDPQIAKTLAEFGRSGVPLYVYYPKGLDAAAVVLPQILTPEIVLKAIALAKAS